MTYDRAKLLMKETIDVPEIGPNIKKEYMSKYQNMKEDEHTTGIISKRNWNGKDVWCIGDQKKTSYVNKILLKLNNYNTEIYIAGIDGMILGIRKTIREIVED